EPRVVILRALQAQGGEALARQVGAFHQKMKLFHVDQGAASFESFAQLPNQYKDVSQLVPQGMKVSATQIAVLDGQNGWWGGEGEPFVQVQGADLEGMLKTAYAMHIATLVPVLDEKGYQLSLLNPQQIDGHQSIGVLITAQGRPDVK